MIRKIHLLTHVAPAIILASVALFWPEMSSPINENSSIARALTKIPSIKGYINKSKFPHVMEVYFTLTLLLIIPYAFLLTKNPKLCHLSKNGYRNAFQKYKKNRIKTILATLMIPALILISIVQPGYEFNTFPISQSRISLALIGIFHSPFFLMAQFTVALGIIFDFEKLIRKDSEIRNIIQVTKSSNQQHSKNLDYY